jgi:hypothetical protein
MYKNNAAKAEAIIGTPNHKPLTSANFITQLFNAKHRVNAAPANASPGAVGKFGKRNSFRYAFFIVLIFYG